MEGETKGGRVKRQGGRDVVGGREGGKKGGGEGGREGEWKGGSEG